VASLKLPFVLLLASFLCRFHDREVVASLKLDGYTPWVCDQTQFPRPRGRGLIEAYGPGWMTSPSRLFPRPRGRGLIEAGEPFTSD